MKMSDEPKHPKDFACPTCQAQIGERCVWDHGGKHATASFADGTLTFTGQVR